MGIDPKIYHYKSQLPDHADLRQPLKELVSQRRRFGYLRLHPLPDLFYGQSARQAKYRPLTIQVIGV
jgi:hypothetical protein